MMKCRITGTALEYFTLHERRPQVISTQEKGGITFSKFDIYVDGALVGTLDQKLAAATYQVRWDYPGQFALGNHTLKLVFRVTSSTVNRGSLDAVIVR